jgi:hypothetical protein
MELPTPVPYTWNDKDLIFHALTMANLLELSEFLRQEFMAEKNRRLKGLPQDEIDKFRREAELEADKIRVGTNEWSVLTGEWYGIAYRVYLSVKKKITYQEALELSAEHTDDVLKCLVNSSGRRVDSDSEKKT